MAGRYHDPIDEFERKHRQLLGAIERRIQRSFQGLHLATSQALESVHFDSIDPEEGFNLSKYPTLEAQINNLTKKTQREIISSIRQAIRSTYAVSTDKAVDLVKHYLGDKDGRLYMNTLQRAGGAVAFQKRWFDNHPISQKVWNITDQFKSEVEDRVTADLLSGTPADQISRNIRNYLNEPNKLFRRQKGADGLLRLSKNARAYHPGQGVYRSSYKNARRLALTEVNNAYRKADSDRWQQLDFVIGVRVQLSNNHTYRDHKGRLRTLVDICDDLQGDYPKDFVFTSWHPHCRCIATPILKSRAEMKADRERILNGEEPTPSPHEVKDMPDNFKQWQKTNASRIQGAMERGTLPHWYRDNDSFIEYHGHDNKQWEKTYYHQKSGGYLVRDRARVQKGTINSNEAKKLAKETRMATTFAKAGYKVEMLKEVTRVPSPDVLINGVKAELKSVESYKKIVKHAKKAIGKQKAEIVLFEFEAFGSDHIGELMKLKAMNIHGLYYVMGESKIRRF